MKKTLLISDDLSLPVDAVTQKLAFLGRTGSGKTFGAGRLIEQMLEAESQVVILDPVGVWWGLRLQADGKSPGFSIPVFGGLKGDIPLEATGGALIADLVVDRVISCVIDVSQFESDAAKARFARDFADRFFFRKKAAPSPVHLVIEEAQEFIPEDPRKEENHMLHAFVRICKLGRNFGIGASIISQRPQEISKKALNQTECLFAFQMTGPHERKALKGWVVEKGMDENLADELPGLATGECYVWSPGWLDICKRIKFLKKETFNSSSTPVAGGKVERRELAPIDLAVLAERMKDTIERAKAEDPRLLRARVAQLEKDLAKQLLCRPPAIGKTEVRVEHVEVSILTKDDRVFLNRILEVTGGLRRDFGLAATAVDKATAGINQILRHAKNSNPMMTMPELSRHVKKAKGPESDVGGFSRPQANTLRVESNGALSGPQMQLLRSLAWWDRLGHNAPTKAQVCAVAGWRPTSGHIKNVCGSLRSAGLIEYPSPGSISFSAAGKQQAPEPDNVQLYDMVVAILSGPQRQVFDKLWEAQATLTREEIVTRLGWQVGSGHIKNVLGSLSSMELIHYPQPGSVALQRWLSQ